MDCGSVSTLFTKLTTVKLEKEKQNAEMSVQGLGSERQ